MTAIDTPPPLAPPDERRALPTVEAPATAPPASVVAPSATPEADGFTEMGVSSASALLDRYGSDCHPLQFLRELVVNAFQGIANLPGSAGGRVVWDLDWHRVEASGGKERKLSIIDTGCGMTHQEMAHFINNLAASGQRVGRQGNFGVGAKIAAGYRNPLGVVYRSWRGGEGAQVTFMRHPDGRWGLGPQTWPDGRRDYWLPLSDDDKPWALRGRDYGTQVTLLGKKPGEDTSKAPSVSEVKATWVRKALNQRFFELPDGVELLVREGNDIAIGAWAPGELHRVLGQAAHLERRSVANGSVELDGAIARWWVLDEDAAGRKAERGEWASTGHVAALFQGELYDFPPANRGGYQRLANEFGVRFGADRVVIYVEPRIDGERVWANTARTHLKYATDADEDQGEDLPWGAWGEQFRAAMPADIERLQERASAEAARSADQRKSIAGRLMDNVRLFKLPRYRAPRTPGAPGASAASADTRVDVADDHVESFLNPTPAPPRTTATGGVTEPAEPAQPVSDDAVPPSTPDAVRRDAEDGDGEPEELEIAVPQALWVSASEGTRALGDLEDVAARYDIDANLLTINADFRVYADAVARYANEYRKTPGAQPVVEACIREWFTQQLVETVVTGHVLAATSPRWDAADLLAECPLTAATLPRLLVDEKIRQRLRQTLGPPAV